MSKFDEKLFVKLINVNQCLTFSKIALLLGTRFTYKNINMVTAHDTFA